MCCGLSLQKTYLLVTDSQKCVFTSEKVTNNYLWFREISDSDSEILWNLWFRFRNQRAAGWSRDIGYMNSSLWQKTKQMYNSTTWESVHTQAASIRPMYFPPLILSAANSFEHSWRAVVKRNNFQFYQNCIFSDTNKSFKAAIFLIAAWKISAQKVLWQSCKRWYKEFASDSESHIFNTKYKWNKEMPVFKWSVSLLQVLNSIKKCIKCPCGKGIILPFFRSPL